MPHKGGGQQIGAAAAALGVLTSYFANRDRFRSPPRILVLLFTITLTAQIFRVVDSLHLTFFTHTLAAADYGREMWWRDGMM